MILVALGGNLPGPDGAPALETCRHAAARLDGLLGCRLVGLSRWFRTAPVPDGGEPHFVNGVAQLAPPVGEQPDSPALLRALLELEARHGRVRLPAGVSRTLDLDLLAVGQQTVGSNPDLRLPHTRLHLRRFVLEPLCDVAPAWRHPVLGVTAAELLAGVMDQACAPLPP